jgi:hypothetical protein
LMSRWICRICVNFYLGLGIPMASILCLLLTKERWGDMELLAIVLQLVKWSCALGVCYKLKRTCWL